MTVTEWPDGRPSRGRGAASGQGAPVIARPAVVSPPSFAPVLPASREVGRSSGRGSGRDSIDPRGDSGRDFSRRGGVGGWPAPAVPPVGVVMPAPAANPVLVPSRRSEAGDRAARRVAPTSGGYSPGTWPRAPQFPTAAPRVTMPPVTAPAPAFAVPQQSWRTHGTSPPAAAVPAPVTVTPLPSSRGSADHDGGRSGRTSPMRGGGRRF